MIPPPQNVIFSDPEHELPVGRGSNIRFLSCHLTPLPPETCVFAHEHPHWELSFMIAGKMTTFCDEFRIQCQYDDAVVFVMPPGIMHHRKFGAAPNNCNLTLTFLLNQHFPTSNARTICERNGYSFLLTGWLKRLLTEIREECKKEKPEENGILPPMIQTFLLTFLRDRLQVIEPQDKQETPPLWKYTPAAKKIADIRQYLAEHIADPKLQQRVADHFKLSVRQINRIYLQEEGETLWKAIQRKRLQQAKFLLKSTEMNLQEIAHEIGFASTVGFHLFFRRLTGNTPKEYRKKRAVSVPEKTQK